MVRTYSLSRDGDKKLSEHFRVREFRSKDGADTILISDELVQVLEAIRSYFGKPITITSGYRTPAHNREVGGAKGSQHVKGTAADIKVKGIPTWAVAGFLEANYRNCGIGYYSTWVHVDTRGYRALWKDYGSNTKGTFGIGNNYQQYEYIAPAPVEEEPEMTIAEIKAELLKDKKFVEKVVEIYMQEKADESPAKWDGLPNAIAWAKQEGIIKGDEDGRLMMQKPLTRQEMVLMMYRASKK